MNTKYYDEWEYYENLAEGLIPPVRQSKKDKQPDMKIHSQEFITIKGRTFKHNSAKGNITIKKD